MPGTLTLLDTPGPNEAGQPQMEVMMRDQLQKASAVLAVMDYTQLNSKADEEVRKELNAIADVSAGRLFVLVNKFDEKDRNGDGADAVRQKVPAMLNSDVLPASRVYPGSSRQAYLANRALHELRKTVRFRLMKPGSMILSGSFRTYGGRGRLERQH